MSSVNERRFRCIVDGRQVTLTFAEALAKFWASSLGWIRPLEWMRYSIGDHQAAFFLNHMNVPDAGRFFGASLLGRGYRPLTIDRYAELLEEDSIGGNLFNAHAARFNRAFRDLPFELKPFEFIRVLGDSRYGTPAYRLRPPLTCCIIVDEVNGEDDVDWDAFRQP